MRAMDADVELKHTPLESEHRALGAKLGPFAGWLMPIEYEGALAEHRAVRERVGLFDLTHLGKVEIVGPGRARAAPGGRDERLATVAVGEAQYNLVLNEGGGVIEDLIVYRLGEERYFVVPNASNTQRVLQMLGEAETAEAGAPDVSPGLVLPGRAGTGVGPRRRRSCSPRPADLGFMQCTESEYRRRPVILTRSGYTGELGFELFTYQDIAVDLWRELMAAVAAFDGRPCGLAARDILRLEMGYPLYGQDLFERRPRSRRV